MGNRAGKWDLENKQSNSGSGTYTTCGDVNIADLRDTKSEDHTAFEHREASSNAAVDRRKITRPSPTGPCAHQANQARRHGRREDSS